MDTEGHKHVLGSTSKIVFASLETSAVAMSAINEGRWPVIGKLHGDFQSSQLKNTSDELKTQDAKLRRALVESCKRYGLMVIGYSGRDQSIMDALEEAIDGGQGYPRGLVWFHRPDGPVFERVSALISKATAAGIQAQIVEVQTFDELLGTHPSDSSQDCEQRPHGRVLERAPEFEPG